MQTAEAKRIREFHTLGKRVLKVYEASKPLADGKRRCGVAQAFNRTLGLQRDQVDKARQFAAMYSDEEVEALCELKSASDGKRITKSHVIRLLAIGNRRERHKLAKQVVREQWSVQRLGAEITRQGKSSEGGRWPKRPSTVGEAMGQIQRMAQQWKRWVKMMSDQDDARGVGIGHLPKAAARAVAKMSAVAKSAEAAIRKMER